MVAGQAHLHVRRAKSGSPSVLLRKGAGIYIASMGAQHIRNGAFQVKQEKTGVDV
jgi:hypothetical protein